MTEATAPGGVTEHTSAELYQRFLEALNTGNYGRMDQLIAPDFVDHHPGFDINGLDSYKAALSEARESLQLQAEAEDILQTDDKVITRVRLTGTHVGTFMGIPRTGRRVTWGTIEMWRVSGGRFAERWAQDDLLGLREQLSMSAENIALVRRVSDVVNAREYGAMDELFAPSFTDHNPAWSVQNLDALKGIIRAAADGLNFTARLDQIYVADTGRVVIHVTFTGRHIGTFFGREPTGSIVEWTSIEVYQIKDGKVAERWVQADTAGLMRQVGVNLPQ